MTKSEALTFEEREEYEEKYRNLAHIIKAVESMPSHLNACKLKAPPFIPEEFKKSKIPSNIFFSSYEFTLLDIISHVKELRDIYASKINSELKSKIDKE